VIPLHLPPRAIYGTSKYSHRMFPKQITLNPFPHKSQRFPNNLPANTLYLQFSLEHIIAHDKIQSPHPQKKKNKKREKEKGKGKAKEKKIKE